VVYFYAFETLFEGQPAVSEDCELYYLSRQSEIELQCMLPLPPS